MISVATIISYQIGPICVGALRRVAPDMQRPLRTPVIQVFAPVAFVLCTLLLYWARWPLTGEVIALVIVAAPIYAWAEWRHGWKDFGQHLQGAWWLIAYLPCMALVSACGSQEFGGAGLLPYGVDLGVGALMGLGVYVWGERSGWRTPAIALHERGADDGTELY